MPKSSFGYVRRHKDNLTYGFKADYCRCGQQVKYGFKVPWQKNEKAAIIRLRKIGFTVQAIGQFTGRSFSVIHNLLRKASMYDKTIRYFSTNTIRKLQYQTHITQSRNRWAKLLTLWNQWEMFVLGDLDKPP